MFARNGQIFQKGILINYLFTKTTNYGVKLMLNSQFFKLFVKNDILNKIYSFSIAYAYSVIALNKFLFFVLQTYYGIKF